MPPYFEGAFSFILKLSIYKPVIHSKNGKHLVQGGRRKGRDGGW